MTGLARNSRTARARAHRAFTASLRSSTETRNRAPDDLDPSRAWYLVFTTPRGEAKAAEGLRQAGCAVFLPSIHKVKVTSRRRMEYDVATFSRYLFAAGLPHLAQRLTVVGPDGRTGITIEGKPITDIRQIEGICKVVSSPDGQWSRVPAAAIAAIAAYQNTTPPPPVEPTYTPGQEVRIIESPFMSFLATAMEQIGKDEAYVLVDIFGRETRVRVELAQIEAA